MDQLKKLINLGFGAIALTKEKITALVDDLVKRGEVSSQDSKKYMDELIAKLEENKKEVEEKIEAMVQATLKKLDIPVRSEIAALKTELESLKKEIKSHNHPHEHDSKPKK